MHEKDNRNKNPYQKFAKDVNINSQKTQIFKTKHREGDKRHPRHRENQPFSSQGSFNTLKVIPLGGLGEIGKNMTVIEYGNDVIIIDCGLMFPGGEMPGIDFVIPNIEYLEKNRHKIRGMIVTHGHEDHAGAIPYIWPKFSCPIYTGKLTTAMIEAKFKEFGYQRPNVNTVNPGESFQMGVFRITTFALSHSIPDELGLIISTPMGKLVFISDFRLEKDNPKEKQLLIDLEAIGRQGVFCLFMDSTNAEREGQSVGEIKIKETIESIIQRAEGRVIVTSFASSLQRIQSVIDAAAKFNRKVAVSGRSMEASIEIAMRLGYLKVPHGVIVDISHSLGRKDIVLPIARAALAAGADGLMFESHFNPAAALCDADTGRLAIYYGGADTVVGLAFAYVDELIDFVKSDSLV